MYSASEWICLDLWCFINVLLIIIIITPKMQYVCNAEMATMYTRTEKSA